MEHSQWLEERRKGVGGSDIAAILGLSPFKTAYQVYQEKRKEVEDWQGNESTDWGSRLEPAIRQWYSDKTGRSVMLPEKILYHEKYPFMLASLDGFTDDQRIVEIKTARSGRGWGEPGTNEIPDYYAAQVHHYMAVTRFDVADVPVSIMGGSPQLYEVPADKEIREMIIEACASFWQRVVDGNPPDPSTYADAVQRFGKSTGEGVLMASQELLADIDALRSIRSRIKILEADEEQLKGNIIITLGDRDDTVVNASGETLATYRMAKGKTSFDAKALAADCPDIYQKYLKSCEPSRRFLLK